MKPPVLLWCSEAKALWGLCWRMMLWTPVVMVLGNLALIVVLCAMVGPPMLSIALIYGGEYLWAVVTLIGWGIWLRFGGPIRRFVFEGWEHGSL